MAPLAAARSKPRPLSRLSGEGSPDFSAAIAGPAQTPGGSRGAGGGTRAGGAHGHPHMAPAGAEGGGRTDLRPRCSLGNREGR